MPELVADQVLSYELAERLSRLIERGASCLVCAGPSGAGKSTLLAALTEFVPVERETYVVRGCHDPLAVSDPARTTLLINELSPHLPIYCWGPAAQRAFALAQRGAQLLSTAHADSPELLIQQLTRFPVSATAAHLCSLDLVIFLGIRDEGESRLRYVERVMSFSARTDDLFLKCGNRAR